LIVEAENPGPDASLYLARALAVGSEPGFETIISPEDHVTPEQIGAASVVILNDTRPPSGAAARASTPACAREWACSWRRATAAAGPMTHPTCWPARRERPWIAQAPRAARWDSWTTGTRVRGVRRAPDGDLTAARMFQYRQCAPAQGATVVARFDDGTAALVERRVGAGTVLTWTSSLDSYWNDLALRPVFVPFVHQAMKHSGATRMRRRGERWGRRVTRWN